MTEPEAKHHHIWIPVIGAIGVLVVIGATVAAPIYYTGSLQASMQEGQKGLQRSLDELSRQVERMGDQVGRLADANAHLDEHMKSVDRRLDVLEKDRTVEDWKRK